VSVGASGPGIDAIVTSVRKAYDEVGGLAYATAYAGIATDIAPILEEFLARGDGGILDLGCGAGRYMAWLESRGRNVVGVDLSPGMLTRARPHVRGALVAMDMRHLGFKDQQFAGIFCASSLHHLPKSVVSPAPREVSRVLVRGGVLFVNVREGQGEGYEHGHEFGAVERCFSRYQPREIGGMSTEAGFTVVLSETSHVQDHLARRWLRVLATNRL